jgi:hypothetical protein
MACACVSFPDQRWLRFLVRGTKPANAIMTAVDQAGNKVIRCRISRLRNIGSRTALEITVHPDWKLTDELALAIAMSDYCSWLRHYFDPGGGGG